MSKAARTVRFFPTCLGDPFFPEATMAAAEVLESAGCRVAVDPEATCCGQPAFNLGYWDEARAAARRVLDQMGDGDDPVVVPSGSCATMMHRFYPVLFEGTPDAERAEKVAARVREWSHYLRRDLDWAPAPRPRDAADGRQIPVTLHPACHALLELGVEDEPRELLEAAGYELVPLPRADACCGFGGGFSVEMPEMSGQMLKDKLGCIRQAVEGGARTVASLDAGCLMHMRGGHERAARQGEAPSCPRYAHVAELIREAITEEGGGAEGPSDP